MRSVFIYSLIFAISWLGASVNGECCASTLDLTYAIEDASCGAAGGHGTPDSCTITICANGGVLMGTFCGRGSCNAFGCNCDGGCLSGNWGKSFLERNREYSIEILEEKWNDGPSHHINFLNKIQLPDVNLNIFNLG